MVGFADGISEGLTEIVSAIDGWTEAVGLALDDVVGEGRVDGDGDGAGEGNDESVGSLVPGPIVGLNDIVGEVDG